MADMDLNRLINICTTLSAERDNNKLLSFILSETISLTNSESGIFYLCESDKICFGVLKCDTKVVFREELKNNEYIDLDINENSACAISIRNNKILNISEINDYKGLKFNEFKCNKNLFESDIKSMLVVPFSNNIGDMVGVLQLINSKDKSGSYECFNSDEELYISAIASQAAIAITNMQYLKEIKDLMQSFVHVLSVAIDEITPYNANHTKNMVSYCERLIEYLNKKFNEGSYKEYFDSKRKEQLIMSIWLHDIGKIVIPLEVMNKATRLAEKLVYIKDRFKVIALQNKINLLEEKIDYLEYARINKAIDNVVDFVVKTDSCVFLTDNDLNELKEISKYTFVDLDGSEKPWLTNNEIMELSVRKGTLTEGERKVMETHVQITSKLLEKMKFNREYKNVPLWAGSHHELLDGSGYPNGIGGEMLSVEVRIITILDIFEALTAKDRPYKKGMTPEKAISVIEEMAEEGKLDLNLVKMVKDGEIWT